MNAPPVHVALLRGINVGGKNKLPMPVLAGLFEAIGCGAVRTYIQSGNVVFRAAPALSERVPDLISAAIARRFGLRVPVVTRTATELRGVRRRNPFLASGAAPETLHVGFLADRPPRAAVAALDRQRSPPDEFVVRGGEIYLRCPNGIGRSKLTNAYFDTQLGTTSTLRNWNTVLALVELAAG